MILCKDRLNKSLLRIFWAAYISKVNTIKINVDKIFIDFFMFYNKRVMEYVEDEIKFNDICQWFKPICLFLISLFVYCWFLILHNFSIFCIFKICLTKHFSTFPNLLSWEKCIPRILVTFLIRLLQLIW